MNRKAIIKKYFPNWYRGLYPDEFIFENIDFKLRMNKWKILK